MGTLSLRGIAKPNVITVVPAADGSPRFEGSAIVRLTDYGLKPPSAALGAIGTKNEMMFTFVLVGSR
jgi:hypothetical protein